MYTNNAELDQPTQTTIGKWYERRTESRVTTRKNGATRSLMKLLILLASKKNQ